MKRLCTYPRNQACPESPVCPRHGWCTARYQSRKVSRRNPETRQSGPDFEAENNEGTRLERDAEKNSVKKGRRLFCNWSCTWGTLSRIGQTANGDKRVRYFLSSFRVIGCSSRALEKNKTKRLHFISENGEEAFCFLIISYFIVIFTEWGKRNKQKHKNYCFFEEIKW